MWGVSSRRKLYCHKVRCGRCLTASRAALRMLAVVLSVVASLVVSLAYAEEPIAVGTGLIPDAAAVVVHGDELAIINERSITSRVLGGGASAVGQWPSVVAIVRPGAFNLKNRFFCGGTVVGERWVMTAAHCLYDAFDNVVRPSSIRVVAGITDLDNDIPAEESVVTNIIINPYYDNKAALPANDIALLELATRINVPASELFAGETENYVGTLGFIVGWGATSYISESNATYPSKLQDATVPLVSLATCNSWLSYDGMVVSQQVCAGYAAGGVDTCVGDSGGPLFIIENGKPLQVGITSFGNGCGLENFYGIYTNISHYIPWLSNYINVPHQDSALVDKRQAAAQGSGSSGDSGTSSGALQPFLLLVLAMIAILRRTFVRVSSRTLRTVCACTVITLSAGGCSANSAGGGVQFINTHSSELSVEANNPEGMNTPTESNMIRLAEGDGRPGVDSLRLGLAREEWASVVLRSGFKGSDCESGKTALKGTGRLFLQERCRLTPASSLQLAGLPVEFIEVHFLDLQLVRLDVVIATNEVKARKLISDLTEQIDAQYERLASTSTAVEWRSRGDHIRVMTSKSGKDNEAEKIVLQFIDGRLEHKMPSLFIAP